MPVFTGLKAAIAEAKRASGKILPDARRLNKELDVWDQYPNGFRPKPYPKELPKGRNGRLNGTRIRDGRVGAGIRGTGCLCSKLCFTIV